MATHHTIHASVRPGEQSGYVAECAELHAVTQGATLDEIAENLREVVGLALEGEDLEALGLSPHPVIVVTFELEPAVAWDPAAIRFRRHPDLRIVWLSGRVAAR